MRKVDILIIGGGVAGLSTAYFLAKKGQKSVAVLEQEKTLGGHASGRNAGMLRQALSDPILAELAIKSRRFFDRASRQGWRDLDLRPNGSLLLSINRDAHELRKIETTIIQLGLKPYRLTRGQAVKKVPVLSGGDFTQGLFCPSDAMVDIDALLAGFLRNLKRSGVGVFCGNPLRSVRRVDEGFRVHAGNEEWSAKKVVCAAGAWAGWVAQQAGASNIPLVAYRRHLFFAPSSGLRALGFLQWPFVWDVSHDFYFRPFGRKLMLSPCDKTPEVRGDRSEKVDPQMRKLLYQKLDKFSGTLSYLRAFEAKSGLRTMTPDGRFALGRDPVLNNFYWAAGLGGHGVTTCFSVGEMTADILLGRTVDVRLERALSPGRFSKKKDMAYVA